MKMSSQEGQSQEAGNFKTGYEDLYDLEYLLIGDIRILLTERFDWRSRSTLLLLLDRLISNLPKVLDLAAKEEYLCTVLERRPNLSKQVDDLYHANLECLSVLKVVRDRLESDKCIHSISEELETLLKNWIRTFATLRHQERRILQEAYVVDLGGES